MIEQDWPEDFGRLIADSSQRVAEPRPAVRHGANLVRRLEDGLRIERVPASRELRTECSLALLLGDQGRITLHLYLLHDGSSILRMFSTISARLMVAIGPSQSKV